MKPYSAWIEGMRYFTPLILTGLVLMFLGGIWVMVGGATFVLGVAVLLFFRDPPRHDSTADNDLVAPADGTIVAIEDLTDTPHYDGPTRRVSIFLSLFNVHINRAPCAGTIRDVTYRSGGFLNAMNPESSDANEANTIRLETEYGPVTVRQIAGLVARRIVCRRGPGDAVNKGEKFGMIKFGSRTELYLPPDTEVCVSLKQSVRAGTTCIARFT
jgi:phosphatidylserine decarboxylase